MVIVVQDASCGANGFAVPSRFTKIKLFQISVASFGRLHFAASKAFAFFIKGAVFKEPSRV
jgi:hypothetical protein